MLLSTLNRPGSSRFMDWFTVQGSRFIDGFTVQGSQSEVVKFAIQNPKFRYPQPWTISCTLTPRICCRSLPQEVDYSVR